MNRGLKLIDERKVILEQLETDLQKRKVKKQESNDAVVAKQETDQIEFRTTDKFTTIGPNVDKIKNNNNAVKIDTSKNWNWNEISKLKHFK